MRGCESVVRYVVRLGGIMELVRRYNFNARLGIVDGINKAGCTQNSVELCLCCKHVENRQAVKQEVQGEWGSKGTLASCSRG